MLFIDYALNDLGAGLEKSYKAWDEMIKKAKKENIKVILLTSSPDQRIDYADTNNELKKHSDQIIRLANENKVGFDWFIYLLNLIAPHSTALLSRI